METLSQAWAAIPGFEGAYEAHPQGAIRSLDRDIAVKSPRAAPYTIKLRGKVLKASISNGYPVVTLWKGSKPTHRKIANLVALTFLGPKAAGLYVCHTNGDRSDSRADNLYYGTPAQNVADARRHGTLADGERAGSAKLRAEDVQYIRSNPEGVTQAVLGKMFGVRQGRISRIQNRHQWKGVASCGA